jgi:Peptidase family M28
MPFALCRAPTGDFSAAAELIENSRLRWVRFGHDYFCYGPELVCAATAARFDAAGFSLRRLSTPPGQVAQIRDEDLHLVVQEGSLFRRAHPQVPVLLDKGRHMLVALDPCQAGRIAQHQARFALRPVEQNQVIFEVAAHPGSSPAADDRTQRAVDALKRGRYAATLAELASYPARHSLSSHFHDAARRACDRLQMMGYQARLEEVDLAGGKTLNVVADKQGARGRGSRVVLVTAHLDTVHHAADASQPEDVTASAPGVDDNGSGSAGVLELASVFKDQDIGGDLRFILFGGQEQGLCGSRQYVARLDTTERARIGAVVNMDMIGVPRTDTPTVLLEGGATVSKSMISGLASAAQTYTGLKVHTSCHYHGSDHVPFIDADVPAVLTVEGNDAANGGVHSASDTLTHIDYDYALDILRMNTAFVMREVGC